MSDKQLGKKMKRVAARSKASDDAIVRLYTVSADGKHFGLPFYAPSDLDAVNAVYVTCPSCDVYALCSFSTVGGQFKHMLPKPLKIPLEPTIVKTPVKVDEVIAHEKH